MKPRPQQLWLLQFKNPLVPRFGKEFFSSIPKCPGVYKMKNERGEIIYVGKAKNLRDRLRSYARVDAGNSSRKVMRLVHLVRSIEWEELESEKAALLRENHLLRTLCPYFNVVNTSPQTYLFVHLAPYEVPHELKDERGIRIHLAMTPDPSYPDIYGAFKGLGVCFRMHKALLRLLWLSFNPCRNGFELPGNLTNRKKLEHYRFPLPPGMEEAEMLRLYRGLKRLFNGTSKALLDELIARLLRREDLAAFTSELIQDDIEAVFEFHEHCAKRNRGLKRKLGITQSLLPQEELDDLLVLARQP